jgi:hypothetical protein
MGFSFNNNVLNQKGSPAIYTDIFANRPVAGFQGRLFISTDTAAIYEDTGTAWTLIANVSSGAGTLQQVTTNGNTSNVGISVTAGGVSSNSLTVTSLTTGSVPFIGAAGLITQDNPNLFWDDTNNRLGVNTNTPGNSLDVHSAASVPILALNNTAGLQSAISFLNTSVAKWRIGNTATNTFDFYNLALTQLALTINGSNNFVQFLKSIMIAQGAGFSPQAGYNGIGGDAGGFFFNLGTNTFSAYFNFIGLTGGRTFTFPDTSGTVALTSNLSAYLPLTGGNLTGNITVSVNTGLSALTLNNASLSGRNWSFINTTNGADTDLSLFYSGTSGGTKVNFANTGAATFTQTGGSFDIDVNGQVISKQNLDVATAGGRFTGQSARGTMGYIQIDQVTTGADGGRISFATCPSGSTTPSIGATLTSAANFLIGSTTDDTVNKLQVTGRSYISQALGIGINAASGLALHVSGGLIRSLDTYNNTSATLANLVVSAGGTFERSTASSKKYKENITNWENKGLETILKLKPVLFNYKKDYYNKADINFLGLIAEDVAEVSPYLAEFENENRTGQVENVRYANIVVPLIAAIKEQQTIIESLIQRIELLENK